MKKIINLILILSLVPCRIFAQGTRLEYEDLKGHWGKDTAIKLLERDIIKGERVGNVYFFYPDMRMRRIDACVYLLSAMKADFSYNDELPEYAKKHKLLPNIENPAPYEYITRAEMMYMIDHAINGETSDTSIKYADDKNIPDWAVQSVKNLTEYKIIQGYENNLIKPSESVTKIEMSQMILKMLEYTEKNSAQTLSRRIISESKGKYKV